MYRRPIKRGSCPPVLIEYVDADRERSARTVAPVALLLRQYEVTRPADLYLQARCSITKALRTFRVDRVMSVGDPATGEIFDLSKWIQALQLGEAKDFQWTDEPEDDAGRPTPELGTRARLGDRIEARLDSFRTRWPVLRAAMLAAAIGYVIGRTRVISWLLHLFGSHKGLWL